MGEKLLLKENVHSFCTVKFFFVPMKLKKKNSIQDNCTIYTSIGSFKETALLRETGR